MKVATRRQRTRVILGATCYADAEAALYLAVQLAKQVGADLQGCLVADDAILSAVARPHASAIAYSGSGPTHVTVDAMRSAFRSDARQFEHQLLRAARQASLASEFLEASGRLAPVLSQRAGVGDLIVFGFRRAVRDGDSLIFVTGGTMPEEEVLQLAGRLSNVLRKRLTVLTTPDLRDQIAAKLKALNVLAVEIETYTGADALLARLESLSPAAVILAGDNASLPSSARVVDAARCPVIVPVQSADAKGSNG